MGEERSSKRLKGENRRWWLIEGGIVVRNQGESGGAAFGWVLSGRSQAWQQCGVAVFGRGRDKEKRASETESVSK